MPTVHTSHMPQFSATGSSGISLPRTPVADHGSSSSTSRNVHSSGKRSRSTKSSSGSTSNAKRRRSRPSKPPHEPYRYVAMSSQHVYARPQRKPMLARISLTDYRGNVLYDSFVFPTQEVQDYRPMITGIRPEQLEAAPCFAIVREQVADCVRGKIIIGHSLWQHLSLLSLSHPAIDTRDVALFLPFHRTLRAFSCIPLKTLVWHLMRRRIGLHHEHPVENARATLDLFRSYEDPWENAIRGGSWPSALPPSSHRQFFS